MIAGGIFAPNAQQLQSIRSSIDERPRRWRRILNENSLKQSFMPGIKTGSREEDALKYFVRENKDSALKTKPKVGSKSSSNGSSSLLGEPGLYC